MSERDEVNKIIRTHVIWSMGAGLMPIPLLDIAAVTAIQMDMLKQLAALNDVDYSASQGKTFVGALAGGTFARIGAEMVKLIPGVGTVVGGVSMSVLSGASTYAVGKIATDVFEPGGNLLDLDWDSAKAGYQEAFEQGKQFVSNLARQREKGQDVFQTLEKISELKEKGVITAEDFETQKQKLMDRL